MKNIVLLLLTTALFASNNTNAQEDKSRRPSPPAKINADLKSGVSISIDYSMPSIKGRIIGKTIEPNDGEIWRTGANEATVFETNKNVKIDGKELPAGKYSLFTISGKDTWTVIFNKTWKQWGAYDYKEKDDALRITVKQELAEPFVEKMNFNIDAEGRVNLLWGDRKIGFNVE
jgi:Protein of unknown function (DUF2911)